MKIRGLSVSEGIAVGKAYLYKSAELKSEDRLLSENADRENEFKKFIRARETASHQLAGLKDSLDPAEGKIFEAQNEILKDPSAEEEIQGKILDEGHCASHAVEEVYEGFAELLEGTGDPLFSARAADMKDVEKRLLGILLGKAERGIPQFDENVILVAEDLKPSDTAGLDKNHVMAIVTEIGGETSHSAIIARKNGIPSLSGIKDVMTAVKQSDILIADAVEGILIISPDEEEIREYEVKAEAFRTEKQEMDRYLSGKAELADGTRIQICANIASADDDELKAAEYTDGVGLLRSEFFYMNRKDLPDEEIQYASYRKVLEAFHDRQVVLRTLDIGGDKKTECLDLPTENNPFLGLRAVRFCFAHEEIFRTQLRAVLRAANFGNLAVMFPMISSVDEIRKVKRIIRDLQEQMKGEGIPAGEIAIGIMIEIPSIALLAEEAAKETDFASIGTNDLCQYLLAADRLNQNVSKYYQKYHPAVFRLIAMASKAYEKAGKMISVCGELGGDPYAAPALVGMGIRKLSMNASSVARVKHVLSGYSLEQCREISEDILKMSTAGEIGDYLKQHSKR